MKAIFVMILLICEVIRNIIEIIEKKKIIILLFLLIGSTFVLNVSSYIKDCSYIWTIDYRKDNELFANFILEEYPNAVYASNYSIRGYMNLLFEHGIYEWVDVERAKQIATEKGKEEVVFIITQEGYKLQNIIVYQVNNDIEKQYTIVDHRVQTLNLSPDIACVSYLTDMNWTNGVSNTANILLFDRDDSLLEQLLTHKQIVCKEQKFKILNVDYDSKWIRVTVDRNADICMYPSEIFIK